MLTKINLNLYQAIGILKFIAFFIVCNVQCYFAAFLHNHLLVIQILAQYLNTFGGA